MLYRLARPLLFGFDAERAHHLGLAGLKALGPTAALARASTAANAIPVELAGLKFPNPVGLAAGLDKNAEVVAGLFGLGFGFVEVGTVTPRPQPGNPKPRLFRIPEQQALINRMGFNNEGAEAMAARLEALRFRPGPLGVNLGKNKDTPNEKAVEDYAALAERLGRFADYLVVNLSSPNTPGLRALQDPKALEAIFNATQAAAKDKPVFVKLSPDLEDEALDAAVDVALSVKAAGLIATNTTLARPFEHPLAKEAGGLSGRPLEARATAVVKRLFRRADNRFPIIGVGGVFDADDAWRKVRAGASLVQLYSGFIYEGPRLPHRILRGLEQRLDGRRWPEIVGSDAAD